MICSGFKQISQPIDISLILLSALPREERSEKPIQASWFDVGNKREPSIPVNVLEPITARTGERPIGQLPVDEDAWSDRRHLPPCDLIPGRYIPLGAECERRFSGQS